ncbi:MULTISPECIES: hypothetical protein [Aeromonas]|uniref:Type I-E CRISPR-associated protein Cas6/Cse3/CasE n=1 Tax=Aeromonas veronii TaxID=654 RepID=A0A4S5CGW3_AERVE|nr:MULTISPECIES: hypothetical protein [Aeromonas]THJ45077.1 hypothetical protein E8Q35_12920 [Aeromonas veronii]
MIFYENSLKLRETPPAMPYVAHQRIDFLLQETLKSKLPYSWKRVAHPDELNSTLVYLRTAAPLNLPGEKAREMSLRVGDMLLCHTNFCFQRKETVTTPKGPKDRAVPLEADALPEVLHRQCEKAGLLLHSHSAGTAYREHYQKKRHKFFLKVFPVSLVVEIRDVSLAEQAIAYGIGHKRVFGYGQLTDMELL